MFSAEQIRGIVAHTSSRLIIGLGEDKEIERAVQAANACDVSLVLPDRFAHADSSQAWSTFTRIDSAIHAPHRMDADALLLLIFSSGTTGEPKGVMHSSNTARFAVNAYARFHAIEARDRVLVVTAFGFVGSSLLGFYLSLLHGCVSVLLRNWNAEAALDAIPQHGITYFLLMPTHAIDILSSTKLDATNCGSVSRGVVAGLNEEQRLDARKRLCALPFPMYGMSESPAHVTGTMSDDWAQLRTSEGRVLPGAELLICDDGGAPVPAGEPGNILVRGPNRFLGYFNADELNRSVITEAGFFRTGDLGFVDGEGFMSFVSRTRTSFAAAASPSRLPTSNPHCAPIRDSSTTR